MANPYPPHMQPQMQQPHGQPGHPGHPGQHPGQPGPMPMGPVPTPQPMPGQPPRAAVVRRGTSRAVPVVVSMGLAIGVFCGLLFGLSTGAPVAIALSGQHNNPDAWAAFTLSLIATSVEIVVCLVAVPVHAAERDAHDVIFDAVGKRSFGACRRALTPHGIYLTTVPSGAILLQALWTRIFGRGRRAAIAFTGLRDSRVKGVELEQLARLVESGAFVPVVDRILPLDELVAAHHRVETGHKVGSVVIAVADAAWPTTTAEADTTREADGVEADGALA